MENDEDHENGEFVTHASGVTDHLQDPHTEIEDGRDGICDQVTEFDIHIRPPSACALPVNDRRASRLSKLGTPICSFFGQNFLGLGTPKAFRKTKSPEQSLIWTEGSCFRPASSIGYLKVNPSKS